MPVERYRIKEPTVAMSRVDGRRSAISVPIGSIVEVESAFEGNKLIEVSLEGKVIMMFTQDLRSRAERISAV